MAEPVTAHTYLSTACWHALHCGTDEATAARLHGECDIDDTRWDGSHKVAATCKWCSARCTCPHHGEVSRG